jgi:Flp pilus assembly protein TadG
VGLILLKLIKRLKKEEQGQALIMVALMLTMLLGFAALVVDVGMMYVTKAELQNAADAAALAGASVSTGNAVSEAKKFARLDGVDDTILGTTILVDPHVDVATGTTTTEKAYTNEELAAMGIELTTELNAKSDADLIASATANSLTTYLTTANGKHTAAEVAAKRTELTNTITAKSDAELISLANGNSLTTYLTTTNIKHTAAEVAAKRTELTNTLTVKSDSELIALATANSLGTYLTTKKIDDMVGTELKILAAANGIDISGDGKSNLNNDGSIKEQKIGDVKVILKNKLGNLAITIISNKPGLITALVNKLTADFENAVVSTTTTINDKPGLIAALVNKQIAAFENEVLPATTTINDKPGLIAALVAKQTTELGNEVVKVGEIKGNSNRVAVTIAKQFSYTFARVLGFTDTAVSAYAVAEKSSWNGEALPFINLNGDAEDSVKGQPLSAWEKVGPGDKERISNGDLVVSSDNTNIKVNYEDGITFKKGKVMSKIQGPLDNMLVVGKTVYLFSLKHSEIPNYVKGGTKELKNGDIIPLSDIVLLECKVTEWDGKIVSLEFENYYHYNSSSKTFLTNMGVSPSGSPRLVE